MTSTVWHGKAWHGIASNQQPAPDPKITTMQSQSACVCEMPYSTAFLTKILPLIQLFFLFNGSSPSFFFPSFSIFFLLLFSCKLASHGHTHHTHAQLSLSPARARKMQSKKGAKEAEG
uniref:Uncharacterized protein n=1 Tax=Oryza brachyantha TaxID=4533 RepID=J3LKC9_ORYBR